MLCGLMAATLVFGAWGAAALWFQLASRPAARIALVCGWLALAAATLAALSAEYWPVPAAFALAAALLLAWWSRIRPSSQRDWIPEVSRQTHGEIQGQVVTLHNVRNFHWLSRTEFVPAWETRVYDLARLASLDMVLSQWGRPGIAHVMVSFGFEDGQQVVFSVEIRRKRGDKFSEIGAFFRMYELSVIAATETDSLRVRTNFRGEEGYLYRVHVPRETAASIFLAYVRSANRLVERPRFYNTVTANCTTIVYQMVDRIVPGLPLDYRILLSGHLPGYLYDLGVLNGADDVEAYRRGGRYTDRARACTDLGEFSRAIRVGVPGMAPADGARTAA
ncbi:Lnb N-terminal periplasmic domain-containing protein [Bordetella sp. 2513F-2]